MKKRDKKPPADAMQIMRMQRYPIQITDNLIVDNNLEMGRIALYEHIDGPVNIQQLIYGSNVSCKNAALVAEIVINDLWQEEGPFIRKIFCEYGHENLIYHMIYQVVNFAKFYECCKSVVISEEEREKWFLYAGGVLADFHKREGRYVYQIR